MILRKGFTTTGMKEEVKKEDKNINRRSNGNIKKRN